MARILVIDDEAQVRTALTRMAKDNVLDAEPGPPSGARPGPRRLRLSAATAGETGS